MNLRKLSDKDLLENTKNLVQCERQLFAEILNHLQEIRRRRLYADLGYRSLWDYCMKGLGFCESQTRRINDALKLIQEIPEVEKIIEKGDVSLTNIVQAQTHFRAEEKAGVPLSSQEKLTVIENLKNKSAREGERILLSVATVERPPVKEIIRQVNAKVSEIRFGADEDFLADMESVKGLLAHKYPNLNTSELMKIVFKMALGNLDPARRAKKKIEEEKRLPKFSPPAPAVKKEALAGKKYISVKRKSEVWKAAESKCEKCGSQYSLEIDHIHPVSLGGDSTRQNLRLLCRNCNQRAAITKIGDKIMGKYLEKS